MVERSLISELHGWRTLDTAPEGELVDLATFINESEELSAIPSARGQRAPSGWEAEDGSPIKEADVRYWRPI